MPANTVKIGSRTRLAAAQHGRTDLHHAARIGDLAKVRALLASGSDPDQSDDAGVTALHFAAFSHAHIVRELIIHGADPNVRSRVNGRPIHHAVLGGNIESVRLLIDAGADIAAVEGFGRTPIEFAEEYRHTHIAKLLREIIESMESASPSPNAS